MWSSWLISISIRFTLIRAHLSQTNRQGDKGGCSSWVSLTTYTPLLFFLSPQEAGECKQVSMKGKDTLKSTLSAGSCRCVGAFSGWKQFQPSGAHGRKNTHADFVLCCVTRCWCEEQNTTKNNSPTRMFSLHFTCVILAWRQNSKQIMI